MNLAQFRTLKTPYVLVLIGPPLVGKSYFCREFIDKIDKDVLIISRDEIVLDVYGQDNYNDAFKSVDQKKVNFILNETLRDAGEGDSNVIVDMTNMVSKRRRTTLSNFDGFNKVAVIFPLLDWDEVEKRNEKRRLEENKSIPTHVLKTMVASYQPIRDLEGFDKVISL